MVAGDWWVVRGVNCGQDEVWRGAYDWWVDIEHQTMEEDIFRGNSGAHPVGLHISSSPPIIDF
jgi:hypothetical protein